MSALPQVAAINEPAIRQEAFIIVHRAACEETDLACWIASPRWQATGAAPLVAVHGIRRGAYDQAILFASRAAEQGRSVIAPLFDEASWPRYQQVVRKGRADLALIRLMDALRREGHWQTERFALTGFSGGAQFAHRFTLLHPYLVAELSVASAGWFTFPDEAVFPYGLGSRPGRWPDWGPRLASGLDPFLSLPIRIAVGQRDNRRDANTRSGEAIDRQQGRTRLERAERWAESLIATAQTRGLVAQVSFTPLLGCRHDFRACVRKGRLDQVVLPSPPKPRPLPLPTNRCATAAS